MFRWLMKKFKIKPSRRKLNQGDSTDAKENRPVAKSLAANKKTFQQIFDRCGDVRLREFELDTEPPVKWMRAWPRAGFFRLKSITGRQMCLLK